MESLKVRATYEAHMGRLKREDGQIHSALITMDKTITKSDIDSYENYLYNYNALIKDDNRNNNRVFCEYNFGLLHL